jgi:endoglucanase
MRFGPPFVVAVLLAGLGPFVFANHVGAQLRKELSLGGYQSDAHLNPDDRLNVDYVLPSDETMRYFLAKGFKTFRLPMYWNRLQPKIGGPLDPDKLIELDAFLKRADALGVVFIPDLHAFGRRDGFVLGSKELPIEALASFWGQFSARYKDRFAGYDIMNEPHDMPSPTVWPRAAQATITAIRNYDTTTSIYVEGDDWSNAERWPRSNSSLNLLDDPARRIIFSAHQYFDRNTSGQYTLSFDKDGATPDIGAKRLAPFVNWLRSHRLKGHIGEYGIPYDDPRWLPVLDNFLIAANANRDVLIGTTYWAAGDWADTYALTVQPAKGGWTDRPQLKILMKRR